MIDAPARVYTRRTLLNAIAAGALWRPSVSAAGEGVQLFWGDLHNHNAVGYAKGSLERTYDIAKSHLDFLAFTPHAQWHDMQPMPDRAEQKWVDGFAATREQWPRVQKMAAACNQPGKFVSFLAYEWHSSFFGDYCVYYPDDNRPLRYFDHVRDLQNYAREAHATIVPHHLAYKQGWRGANFDFFDPAVAPAIEIYSEHGSAQQDEGPFDYIRHSNGGRSTRNTVDAIMAKGCKVGFIASTDDHLGYPGAWGEGLAGIYAKDLSREALLEALWARRTIAVTGDRIGLVAKLNGNWMGSSLRFTRDRELSIEAAGEDEVERVDVIKNGRVMHRHFPEDHITPSARWPGEVLCRLEFGWGPWAALGRPRVCDWDVTASVRGGELVAVTPCFQSGPFDEQRRNRIVSRSRDECRFQMYSSRPDAFEERATNAVVLHIRGERSTALDLELKAPAKVSFRKTLGELAVNNEIEFTGPFTTESFLVHRLVTPNLFRAQFRI